MKRVYIAGKLVDDAPKYNVNKKKMIQVAIDAKHAGFAVFVPCLEDKLAECDLSKDWDYSDYFNNSQPWLEVSDAVLLVPGWEDSEGTRKEIETARELGIPVFDCLDCLFQHFNEQDEDEVVSEFYGNVKVDGDLIVNGKIYGTDFVGITKESEYE